MSFKVYNAVLDYSVSEGSDRCVLLTLAETAHHDGVTWPRVGEGKDDEEPTICRRARVSKSSALRAIAYLRELGELQVVKVRRGKTSINVYRVVVGPIAFVDVDYDRLPFDLPHRFGEPVQGVKLTPSTESPSAAQAKTPRPGTAVVEGVKLTPSNGAVTVSGADASRCQNEAVQGVSETRLKVSHPRARAEEDEPSKTPAAEPEGEPENRTAEKTAAAEPSVRDSDVTRIVRELPGADVDSPKRIVALAHDLPRAIFEQAIATLDERMRGGGITNACGLLVHLLRIARAERTAALSAQLLASLGPARPYVPAPWTTDALKREEPDRYVRLLARVLSDQELSVALADHGDRLEQLLELASAVRAGSEAEAQRDTPEQARRRWVERHAATDADDDVDGVIDAWHDVDDVERQDLRELAAAIRDGADPEATEAEAA